MNSRPLLILFLTLLLGTVTLAQTKGVDLLAEGDADDFWVAATVVGTDNLPMTSIRQRVDATSGKWTEIARLQDRLHGAAVVDHRLAVLTGDGWRLLSGGSNFIGPPLTNGRAISCIAGDGAAMWALAGQSAEKARELFRWDADDGWALMSRLPGDATATGSLALRDGVPWVAYVAAKKLCVDRAAGGGSGWERVAEFPLSPSFKLVSGGTAMLLAWGDSSGAWQIYDLSAKPAALLHTSAAAAGPSDVTVAGTSLRVVSLASEGVRQQGFDDFGRGAAFGPDTIAQVALPVQAGGEWANFLLMFAITAAMLVTMRARSQAAENALTVAHLRLAPVGRRCVAGLIDALPYLAADWYVAQKLRAGNFEGNAPFELYLPMLAGLAIYILHVGISELLFGRSLGKALFGLRVVTVDGTNAPAGRIVLRNLMRVLDVAAFGLPFLLIIFSPTRQRFGDIAAKTVVVTDAAGPAPDDGAAGESDVPRDGG